VRKPDTHNERPRFGLTAGNLSQQQGIIAVDLDWRSGRDWLRQTQLQSVARDIQKVRFHNVTPFGAQYSQDHRLFYVEFVSRLFASFHSGLIGEEGARVSAWR